MLELEDSLFHWFKRHHFLYIFGFFLYFRPIDSFYYEFLTSSKNITEQQYSESMKPIAAYSSVVSSFIIFLVIIFETYYNFCLGIMSIASLVCATAWWQGVNLLDLQMAEGFKGCMLALEPMFFASIYYCHDVKSDFSARTALIRGIPLEAKLLSGIIGQLVVTNAWLTYQEVAFLSLPACVHAAFLLLYLPLIYEPEKPTEDWKLKLSWFKRIIKKTFSDSQVLKLSFWTAFTISGSTQLSFSMQSVWKESQIANSEAAYNGAVSAVVAFLALLAVLISGTIKGNKAYEGLFLCIVSLLQSALLFAFANVDSAMMRTVLFIIFEIISNFAITSVSAVIAKTVYDRDGSVGVIFTSIGIISSIQNVIFASVVNNNGIYFTIKEEFMVYGGFYLVITFSISFYLFVTTVCKTSFRNMPA